MLVGTALSNTKEVISSENVFRLANVARWGKGNILGAAFAPDGESFVVGSAFGFKIYSNKDGDIASQWIPFDQPFTYENMFFSEDGNYILLENLSGESKTRQIRSYADGQVVSNLSNPKWQRTSVLSESWGDVTANSIDDQLQFKSHVTHDEDFWDYEFSVREIFDKSTGELLFELPDETIQVTYQNRTKPEGCDLSSFSYCGNVYSPSASHPYRVAFSPTNKSLAVLYRPPNLWNSNRFSTLRVYDANNGQLLSLIGGFSNPVETFDYSPNGETILVGFVDGSVQLWHIANETNTFSAWQDFNSPIIDIEYSYDGKYLMIQRYESIEVRLVHDGALKGRYDAVAVSISPVDNRIAIGSKDGTLRVFDIDNGRTIFDIQAHEAEIYALAFSPDGQRITSSGEDCDVRNWDAATGELIHYFEENITDAYLENNTASRIFIYQMKYVPDTNHLLGYGSWGRVVSWNTNSGATQYLIEPEPLEYYNGMITLNPHFPEFFSINQENQEFYIDYTSFAIETGEKTGEYMPPENLPEGCASTGPISNDGKLLFSLGYGTRAGKLCVLDTETYELLSEIEVISSDAVNYYVDVDWVYMSPNKNQLVVSLYGGLLYVYEVIP